MGDVVRFYRGRGCFAVLLCLLMVAGAGCDSTSNDLAGPPEEDPSDPSEEGPPPSLTTWEALGQEDLELKVLRVIDGRLYVSAEFLGLMRRDMAAGSGTWEQLGLMSSVSRGQDVGIADVLADPDDPQRVLAAYRSDVASDPSVFRSLMGGRIWERADSGLEYEGTFGQRVVRVQRLFQRADTVFANGFYATTDFGDSWHYVPEGRGPGDWDAVAYHAASRGVWAGGTAAGGGPALGRSDDGGVHWTSLDEAMQRAGCEQVLSLALDPERPEEGYAGCHDRLLRTQDAGQSWTHLDAGTGRFIDLLVHPTYGARLWALRAGDAETALLRSNDGGETWHPVVTPFGPGVAMNSLCWDDGPGALLVGTSAGAYRLRP